MTFTTDVNK